MSLRGDWLLHKAKRDHLKSSVAESFARPSRQGDELAPDKFPDSSRVSVQQLTNSRLVTLVPKTETDRHVVLFHGGAYRVRGFDSHRDWMVYLADQLQLKVTYIDFPLSPEFTVETTVPETLVAYDQLVAQFPTDRFAFLGDSAGGGLALVILQQLRDRQQPLPVGTVLVSPWADLEMSDTELARREVNDPELPLTVMQHVAAEYAGQLPLDHPWVSPVFGDLQRLGRIGLFYGTTELLVPDYDQLFAELREAEGTTVEVFALKNMMHDYLLWLNLPESKRTFGYLQALFE